MGKEMKKFYIDFCGWTEIEAASADEAKDKFWDMMYEGTGGTCVEIEGVEEAEDE